MALITYAGHGFTVEVPGDWSRLATDRHIAVFLGRQVDGIRSSITLSRHPGSATDAAERACSDHVERFANYEILHESAGVDSFYRRYGWTRRDGPRIIQHQLFASGLVLTCSRIDSRRTAADEEVFRRAIKSLRVEPEVA